MMMIVRECLFFFRKLIALERERSLQVYFSRSSPVFIYPCLSHRKEISRLRRKLLGTFSFSSFSLSFALSASTAAPCISTTAADVRPNSPVARSSRERQGYTRKSERRIDFHVRVCTPHRLQGSQSVGHQTPISTSVSSSSLSFCLSLSLSLSLSFFKPSSIHLPKPLICRTIHMLRVDSCISCRVCVSLGNGAESCLVFFSESDVRADTRQLDRFLAYVSLYKNRKKRIQRDDGLC